MKKLLFVTALAALLMPVVAAAQSLLDGTWKVDTSNVDFPKKPDVFLLQNGTYSCKTCTPAVSVKADGTDQSVTGIPYIDTMAIEVVNDHEIKETDKKNGNVVGTATTTVSRDGKTLSFEFSNSSDTNGGPPVTGKGEETRVAKGPSGSHAVSGSWRPLRMDSMSDNGTVVTYKTDGDQLTMTAPTGQTYTAKLDGSEAPYRGDPGVSSVQIKMIGQNTFEETDKRDGKAISVFRMTVGADGKTARGVVTNLQNNTTTAFAMAKQ